MTTGSSAAGEPVSLRQGAGLPRPGWSLRPGLVYDVPATAWRRALEGALKGNYNGDPILPAFHDAVSRYAIPEQYFFDLMDGVNSDLHPRRFETFDDVYRYCYQVASVVGMTTVHVFGFESPAAVQDAFWAAW